MTTTLDLSKRAWLKSHGDVTAIGTWIVIEGRHRPCLVLIRTAEEMSDHTMPCVVTVDKAWIWSEDIGDPRLAAHMAFGFAQALRLSEHDPHTIIRIAGIVHDHLGDLLHIPPYRPADNANVVAELTVTDRNTGKSREAEIDIDV